MTDASDPSELPLDRAPLGARAGRALIGALVGKHDSIVERYLERKGRIDLTDRRALAKLAKFILGAANREAAEAARYFEGYGVMVIGLSSDGEVEGATLPDPEQWEDGITRFIGVDGPRWDINPVKHPDAEDSVLILLVDPPKQGDPVRLCRADGEKIDDGRVYIRRRGKTVQADSTEMQMLFARAAATDPKMELDVSLVGEAVPVTVDLEATFGEYLARKREELLTAMPEPEPEPEREAEEPLGPLGSGLAGLGIAGLQNNTMAELAESTSPTFELAAKSQKETTWSALGLSEKPEPRSEQEYLDEIDAWVAEFRSMIPEAVDGMAACVLDPIVVRVQNLADAHLEDVSIAIHLGGEVRAIEWIELDRKVPWNHFDLPRPPRKWGPVKEGFLPPGLMQSTQWQPGPMAFNSPTVSWRNSGSVDLEVAINPLPPRELHTDDSSEFVLLLPPGHTEDVRGTWTATAKGHHKRYEGEFVVPAGDELDVTEPIRRGLLRIEA